MRWFMLGAKITFTFLMAFAALFFFSLLLAPFFSPDEFDFPYIMAQNMAFVLAAYVSWRRFEKKPASRLGFQSHRPVRDFVHGSLLGITLIGGLFLLLWMTPWMKLTGIRGAGVLIPALYSAALFLIVAAGEEVFTRGYLQTLITERLGVGWGISATSLIFSALHSQNPALSAIPVVNLFLAGVLLGFARWVTGSLWLPMGLHFTWNWTQDMLSLPVSGLRVTPAPFITAAETGPNWLTGGAFGLEGGVAVTVALAGGILWLYGRHHSFGWNTR
ncbi:hypothetical protein C8P63_11714 [Melghirimyces profundicolus]|uniref:CAAX prenyl protease 2/Lysostaphin resistance protein A-like domain-containing protein n=1 Tax=Melghirimyces profundicolus TaxID=1242148 RepID=A0A2T6BQM2_9BACL|nr:type II CAAX endopeptidase family protein [Melghirimyces profundicolus]PTX58267.1 hypothetical protein C8P63_11714 [Melghirimyces profundicolus]